MSPKLFEYKGIVIKFFSDDHTPHHVHAIYGEYKMRVEFKISNERITGVRYKDIGKKKFPASKLKQLKELIEHKKYDIIGKWVKFYVYKVTLKSEKIEKL